MGLIQPVLRGLMGSRVSILDGGVPLVGGRWGQDHGVLADPVLYDGVDWVPCWESSHIKRYLWLPPFQEYIKDYENYGDVCLPAKSNS